MKRLQLRHLCFRSRIEWVAGHCQLWLLGFHAWHRSHCEQRRDLERQRLLRQGQVISIAFQCCHYWSLVYFLMVIKKIWFFQFEYRNLEASLRSVLSCFPRHSYLKTAMLQPMILKAIDMKASGWSEMALVLQDQDQEMVPSQEWIIWQVDYLLAYLLALVLDVSVWENCLSNY